MGRTRDFVWWTLAKVAVRWQAAESINRGITMTDGTRLPALSADAEAIIAANLVGGVVLLRANRWDEKQAKTYVLAIFDELREEVAKRSSSTD